MYDPREVTNKQTIVNGFFTGIGIALSVPVATLVFRLFDTVISKIVG